MSSSTGESSRQANRVPPPTHILDARHERVPEFGPQPGGQWLVDNDWVEKVKPGCEDNEEWEEWEYEEEEWIVTLDLGTDASRLVQSSAEYSLTGLETPTPLLGVGNYLFKGSWAEQLLGSEIVVSDKRDPSRPFPHQRVITTLPTTPTDIAHALPPSCSAAHVKFQLVVQHPSQADAIDGAQVAAPVSAAGKKDPKPRGRPKMSVPAKAQKMLEKALKGEGKFAKKATEQEGGSEDDDD